MKKSDEKRPYTGKVSLLTAIPNVSEGRSNERIAELGEAVGGEAGGRLLDVSADADHHRTVFTTFGDPAALEAGVLAMSELALRRLDLRHHAGAHPRLGIIDVVPFVAYGDASMDLAIGAALATAERLGTELRVPVFLYGAASRRSARRRPITLRRLDLDAVASAIATGELVPDFGPHNVDEGVGVTLVGARPQMVAFNVQLASTDLGVAQRIASRVRESSGGLRGVQALGFFLERRGLSQVSMNVFAPFDFTLHDVLARVTREAESHGVAISDVEIVGLAPEAALCDGAGRVSLLAGVDERQVLETAIAARAGG